MHHVIHHDVAVVGARAAGAATALLLARMGHDVVVLDRDDLPSDTLSTHLIARSGVVQLHRWGLLDEVLASGAPPIRDVTFHTVEGPVTRRVKDRAGVDLLVAPRRYVLDTIVARAAADAGTTLRLGHTVTGLRRDAAGSVTGLQARDPGGKPVEIAARVVVGADGLRSTVARLAGAPVADARPPTGSTLYAYYSGPWPALEFFPADGAFAGVFPTHGGEACIWACVPADAARAARRIAGTPGAALELLLSSAAPDLARRLRSRARTSRVWRATRLPNQVRQASGPGWALVGDALYNRDPVTGHGISDAYRDAEGLATAIDAALRGERSFPAALDGYRRQADADRQPIFDLACAMGDFPPVDEFVELQLQLSDAIEAEATALVARSLPPVRGRGRLAVA